MSYPNTYRNGFADKPTHLARRRLPAPGVVRTLDSTGEGRMSGVRDVRWNEQVVLRLFARGVVRSAGAGQRAAGRADRRLAGGVPSGWPCAAEVAAAAEDDRRLVDTQRKVDELQLEVDILRV